MTDSKAFDGLRALFVNTSLKKDGSQSHTRLLMGVSAEIMEKNGVRVDHVHMLDHAVPPGVYPDMTEHGWDRDDWPDLWAKVKAANILVVGTPLWLGEESSVCRVLIERLYGMSGMLNDKGQSVYYGDDHSLCAWASGLYHPATGRLRLDRRGGAGAVLWR